MSLNERSLYEVLGGETVLRRLAETFYDIMERDAPVITALHELDDNGKITARARHSFWRFLCLWTGGPDDYFETSGHPRLRRRHRPFPIDEAGRDSWLACMSKAMDELAIEGEARSVLDARFDHMANKIMNT